MSPTVHVFAIGPSARESQGRHDSWALDLAVTKSPLLAGLKQQSSSMLRRCHSQIASPRNAPHANAPDPPPPSGTPNLEQTTGDEGLFSAATRELGCVSVFPTFRTKKDAEKETGTYHDHGTRKLYTKRHLAASFLAWLRQRHAVAKVANLWPLYLGHGLAN